MGMPIVEYKYRDMKGNNGEATTVYLGEKGKEQETIKRVYRLKSVEIVRVFERK
jgi:hypothetical protein